MSRSRWLAFFIVQPIMTGLVVRGLADWDSVNILDSPAPDNTEVASYWQFHLNFLWLVFFQVLNETVVWH